MNGRMQSHNTLQLKVSEKYIIQLTVSDAL